MTINQTKCDHCGKEVPKLGYCIPPMKDEMINVWLPSYHGNKVSRDFCNVMCLLEYLTKMVLTTKK